MKLEMVHLDETVELSNKRNSVFHTRWSTDRNVLLIKFIDQLWYHISVVYAKFGSLFISESVLYLFRRYFCQKKNG